MPAGLITGLRPSGQHPLCTTSSNKLSRAMYEEVQHALKKVFQRRPYEPHYFSQTL
jgi:hypothetical protein